MKSVAYIITRENISEILEEDILSPILKGEHGAQITAFYFAGDGVYHLIKGSRNAKNIKVMIEKEQIAIYVCQTSLKDRKLQNVIIENVKPGTLKDFYDATSDTDHIISF